MMSPGKPFGTVYEPRHVLFNTASQCCHSALIHFLLFLAFFILSFSFSFWLTFYRSGDRLLLVSTAVSLNSD